MTDAHRAVKDALAAPLVGAALADYVLDALRALPVEHRMDAMGMTRVERAWWGGSKSGDAGIVMSMTTSDYELRPDERPLYREADDAQ